MAASAGWYDGYGDLVSWSASYSFKASTDVSYTARFVAAREDWLWVYGDDQRFDVGKFFYGNDNLYDYFSVESGSAPTIKITGLPSGLKYDATTRTISGQATKRGVYYVTCSVQTSRHRHRCYSTLNA